MNTKKHKPTISDIAAAAGVSKTTISRYINGKSELMSSKTSERIKTVIELLDYQPSSAARSLKTKNTKQIGVLLSDMDTPFSTALATGISNCLSQKGYDPLFVSCGQSPANEKALINVFISKNVAGLLVNTTTNNNPSLIKAACDGCPIVLCDRLVNNYNFNVVTFEQEKIFTDLVLHLKENGYSRPVLFTQRWDLNSTRQRRREAFIAAVKKIYGYSPENDIYIVSSRENITALQQLEKLMETLTEKDKPVIIGTNSMTTVKTYKAIMNKSLTMPDDIGLCGPEDWDWDNEMNWPTLLKPSITTMYVPTKQMGYKAAELLVDLIEDNSVQTQTIVLPCELHVRESTRINNEKNF